MSTNKVTLNIDSSIYNKFKKYCKERGLVISKIIELFMKEKIEGENKNEKQPKSGS
jgi:antitoxin component of RelBE/YafQ-DinJ toxin-antitoxin module